MSIALHPAPQHKRKRIRGILYAALSLAVLVSAGCAGPKTIDSSLQPVTKPYAFSISQWELKMTANGPGQPLFATKDPDGIFKVNQYFALGKQINNLQAEINRSHDTARSDAIQTQLASLQQQRIALTTTVETTIGQQIRAVLSEQGIYSPWPQIPGLKIGFPPVVFGLQDHLHLLVISPRDKIESLRTVMLNQDLTPAQMKQIESDADKLGVSSLVTDIGGFAAAYPTFVNNDMDLENTIIAATHEWLHQYLAFRPLGFRYVLDLAGISRNYDIAQINETVAGMLGDEIGGMVYQKYYATDEAQPTTTPPPPRPPSAFDFNKEMQQTRTKVDQLLAQGKIDEAEQFMEQERQFLETKGYYIRKLNQAYFAFYGTYGDSPTSVSVIGKEIRQLRADSPSIKDFLDKASDLTGPDDLAKLVTAPVSLHSP